MKKKQTYLMAAVCVLAVLCGLYAVLAGGGEEEPKEAGETIPVTKDGTVTSIAMEPGGETAYTLLIRREDEPGGRSIWLEGCGDSLAIDVDRAGTLLASLERLKAYEEVQGNAADYGISPESSRATIRYEDGTALTLVFGAQAPVAGRTYVQAEETGRLYVVRTDIADLCGKPAEALRKAQLMADFFGTREAFAADRIELFKGEDGRSDEGAGAEAGPIIIRKQTEKETASGSSDSPAYYRMEKPAARECSDGKVNSELLEAALLLDGQAEVEEDFPADPAVYGLGEGCGTIVVRAQDKECELRIGSETQDGYRYVMRADLPVVMKAPAEAFTMLELRWYDLINPSIWMRSIDKIEAVTIAAPEADYQLKLLRNDKGGLRGGTLNGTELKENEVRDLYMAVLNVHIEGLLEKGFPENRESEKELLGEELPGKEPPGNGGAAAQSASEAEYEITLHRLDGGAESARFRAADARKYAIEMAGEKTSFYTGASALTALTDACGKLTSKQTQSVSN